jgi:hypothetical protein
MVTVVVEVEMAVVIDIILEEIDIIAVGHTIE